MTRTLNSSDLYELLYDTLLTTEKVKRTLKTNCDEATYVLKPWQVEITVENRANDICTRKKVFDIHILFNSTFGSILCHYIFLLDCKRK